VAKKKYLIFIGCGLIVLILLIRYLPDNLILPDEGAFTLSCTDVPERMKAGETVTVIATLENRAWRSFRVTRRLQFVYVAVAEEGVLFMPDAAGVGDYMAAGVDMRETTVFTPKKPGNYTLYVFAAFSVGDKSYEYQLENKTIVVEP